MGNFFSKKKKYSGNIEHTSDSTKTPGSFPGEDPVVHNLETLSLENEDLTKNSEKIKALSDEEFLVLLTNKLSKRDVNVVQNLPTVFKGLKDLYIKKVRCQ